MRDRPLAVPAKHTGWTACHSGSGTTRSPPRAAVPSTCLLARRRQAHDFAGPLLARLLVGGQLHHRKACRWVFGCLVLKAWRWAQPRLSGTAPFQGGGTMGGACIGRAPATGPASTHLQCQSSCPLCTRHARSRPCASCALHCKCGAEGCAVGRRQRWRRRRSEQPQALQSPSLHSGHPCPLTLAAAPAAGYSRRGVAGPGPAGQVRRACPRRWWSTDCPCSARSAGTGAVPHPKRG